MQTRILDILTNEQLLRLSGACADDGRPLAHQVFFDADCWEVPGRFHQLAQMPRPLSPGASGPGRRPFRPQLWHREPTLFLADGRQAGSCSATRNWLRSGVPARQLRVQSVGRGAPLDRAWWGRSWGRYRRPRDQSDYVQAGAEDLERIPAPGSPVWWRARAGRGGRYTGFRATRRRTTLNRLRQRPGPGTTLRCSRTS